MISAHDVKDSYQCHKCDSNFSTTDKLGKHQKNIKENLKKKFKCKSCGEINGESQCLECKSKFRRSKQISKHTNLDQQLKVASLNICRGLFCKEELLESTIKENNFDVCSVCEVDIETFDIRNPFSIHMVNENQ